MSKISFLVDVESFSIDEEEYKKVNDMNSDQQRIWLANKILEGICGVDQIIIGEN